jgi:hypothetical protein
MFEITENIFKLDTRRCNNNTSIYLASYLAKKLLLLILRAAELYLFDSISTEKVEILLKHISVMRKYD